MREMSFLPHQDYMMFQSTPQHHDLDHNHRHHQLDSNSSSISLNMLSSCPPQDLHQGGRPMVPTLSMMNRSMAFPSYPQNEPDHNHNHNHNREDGEGEDLSDDGSQVVAGVGEKKKRLNMEQVRALEKTFEQGNKLEPDRKVQLAKALGLQPRQIAIWFQNRRARWKTKQLEKDYSCLKRQFDVLKADHESLVSHNKQLHAQLLSLRSREGAEYGAINLNNNADTRSYWSNNGSEISSDINLATSITPQNGNPLSSNLSNKIQFPTNSFFPNNVTQLLQNTPTKPNLDLHCPKIDSNSIQDDTFCNLFGGDHGGGGGGRGGDGGGDQNQPLASFWGWPQQHLN